MPILNGKGEGLRGLVEPGGPPSAQNTRRNGERGRKGVILHAQRGREGGNSKSTSQKGPSTECGRKGGKFENWKRKGELQSAGGGGYGNAGLCSAF